MLRSLRPAGLVLGRLFACLLGCRQGLVGVRALDAAGGFKV